MDMVANLQHLFLLYITTHIFDSILCLDNLKLLPGLAIEILT